MASKLADILKQEYKTKGLISGAASAINKSNREKLDIRNTLFGGSGLGSVIGRKIFGKGYSALGSDEKVKTVSEVSSESASLATPLLEQISQNTSYMPAMARDMNVLRQNFSKFLISQKVAPSNTPDKYFESAKQRENAYESKFQKKSSPERVIEKDEGSNNSSMFSFIAMLGSLLASVVGAVGRVGAGLVGTLGSVLGGALGLLGLGKFGRVLGGKGKLLGLLGLGGAAYAYSGDAAAAMNPFNIFDAPSTPFVDKPFGSENTTTPGTNPTGSNPSSKSLNLKGDAIALGATGVNYAANKLGIKNALNTTAKAKAEAKFATKTSSLVDSAGKAISYGEKLPLTDKIKAISDFATKAKAKGWLGRLFYAAVKRFGLPVAGKISQLLASLIAAPFSGGASLALTAINIASWAYLIYDVYEWLFGDEA